MRRGFFAPFFSSFENENACRDAGDFFPTFKGRSGGENRASVAEKGSTMAGNVTDASDSAGAPDSPALARANF